MPASDIVIKGAREHNLRDVDLVLPRNQLICLTGVSGSGKSSLAFDTLYAEGQRRYVESLSSFARQFLGQMPKPDVDYIGGLSPSISISQKSAGRNPRSTVGTITEIYDYLRVLYARVGDGNCPQCGQRITAQTREQIIERILEMEPGSRFLVLAPVIRGQKGSHRDLCDDFLKQGYVRARIDGQVVRLSDDLQLDRQMRHNIELVVDRLENKRGIRNRLAEAVDAAIKVGEGTLIVAPESSESDQSASRPTKAGSKRKRRSPRNGSTNGDVLFSVQYACIDCHLSFQPPSPQLFSFNSPQGMCLECDGLGEAFSFDVALLIPDPSLSFKDGCFELLGKWKSLGRWWRHIYQGVAHTMERRLELPEGTLLETPWQDLAPELQQIWLWGTAEQHITFTWRSGASPAKYGGHFDGIIPGLLSKYGSSKSRIVLQKLEKYMRTMRCPECNASRLNPQARSFTLSSTDPQFADRPERSLPEVAQLPISDAATFFSELRLDTTRQIIATEALKEIRGRLGFLTNVGLDYLTLDRTAPTLSGGESQRIRLAGQIGSGLVGVLYILDEPSIGLHPRDNDRLLGTLAQLRDVGNTVIVVEHDEDTMRASDHMIDFGPGPGVRGGEVVAQGSVEQIMQAEQSITGQFLSGKRKIAIPTTRRTPNGHWLRILGAKHNNLKQVDFEIPLGTFVCVTGVSGSGKSSLVNGILSEALRRDLNGGKGNPGPHQAIEGMEHLDKLIAIDQSPIGRTPRSNPATYIKVFDDIRKLFAQLPESKRRGYKPGRFSFNVDGGRCQACNGNGSNKLEMDFLADLWVTCPVCAGHRFNAETLRVQFKEHSISNVLEMDVQQALELFENMPAIHHKLQTLHSVGLDYLHLGQPSPTLSGGEAQRIKLARELVKKSTGKTLYLLDEPTTGLHFADIHLLLDVLHDFVDAGNTVLVVEHNLDVAKTADYIIDLGPEGGAGGGRIVAAGTPEEVAGTQGSYTGQALAKALCPERQTTRDRSTQRKKPTRRAVELSTGIDVFGAEQHNLKHVSAKIPRDKMTVFCGPSGSGKSSLAMDTIYAEGQRRYVESLSSYARQFVSQMQKPRVDRIEGLSPAIALEQQNLGQTPRSTVGTVTEIHDYLRILISRAGTPFCPDCDIRIGTQSSDEVVDKIMAHRSGTRLYLMAPIEIEVGQHYGDLFEQLRSNGYLRVRVDGKTYPLDDPPAIDRRRKHDVEVVVDRIVVKAANRARIAESVEATLALGRGLLHVAYPQKDLPESRWKGVVHSQHLACDRCGRSFEPLSPHHFSFNSHLGWCPQCEGLGTQTGANPAALLRDQKTTLADGVLLLWPHLSQPVAQCMLTALAHGTGIPLDLPWEQLGSRQRRLLMHGTGDQWFDVLSPGRKKKNVRPLFRFQFKGIYPALEQAARISPHFRSRLDHFVDEVECSACGGSRLRDDAAAMRFRELTIDQLSRMPLGQLQEVVDRWKLSGRQRRIAGELVREIRSRVKFLNDVGLDYLTIGRGAATLSGGEAQRIRLASQLGSGLCGVLYVLDEPTIGLHPRDNRRLIKALHGLRDLGNTLLLVEHDREVISNSDKVLDFGPRAGKHGGEIVAQGTPKELMRRRHSVTGPYLSGKKAIPIPSNRRPVQGGRGPETSQPTPARTAKTPTKTQKKKARKKRAATTTFSGPPTAWLEVQGARHHNLQNVTLRIPLGTLTAVTGPSGSGKSSLIDEVLYASLARQLHRARTVPGTYDKMVGMDQINKVIRVDQRPLGNSPSSNPATYTGVFELIRQLFSQLPESKLRGYTQRRFSFNVPGGRCEDCHGEGQVCIEMHFLPDVWVTCETCQGRRYNPETLSVRYRGHSIADVLALTCGEAAELLKNLPKIRRTLKTLCDVGLDYLTLGQPAPTLSGGEAQRVKLAAELSRPDTGQTLYLLDEPTTGLHFEDLARLLDVIHRLVDLGNTVVIIEHNLDIIKSADWVIDMGPEAGANGGRIVIAGTPEEVADYGRAHQPERRLTRTSKRPAAKSSRAKAKKHPPADDTPRSHTGEALAPILEAGPHTKRHVYDPNAAEEPQDGDLEINDVGREAKMPWQLDGHRWHTQDRVSRNGRPCRWDGRILSAVIDRIQAKGTFRATDYNSRSVVEVTGPKKADGWFLHAITAEEWLVKLKFRVQRNTFKRDELRKQIPLATLNEMEALPIYSNEPRIQCKNLRGPWQEIELRLHSWKETDRPEFWKFVDQSVVAFTKLAQRKAINPEDMMPWKKLGEKWHFSRKGFPPGKPAQWETELLEELCELLRETASDAQFLWNNQQVVHLFVRQQREPWATLYTKRPTHVDLVLTGPKGRFALGRVSQLGRSRQLDAAHTTRDIVKLKFRRSEDLQRGDLDAFLREHLSAILQASQES